MLLLIYYNNKLVQVGRVQLRLLKGSLFIEFRPHTETMLIDT